MATTPSTAPGSAPVSAWLACWTMAAPAASRQQVKLLQHLAPAMLVLTKRNIGLTKMTIFNDFSLKSIQLPNINAPGKHYQMFLRCTFAQPTTEAYSEPSGTNNGDITRLLWGYNIHSNLLRHWHVCNSNSSKENLQFYQIEC